MDNSWKDLLSWQNEIQKIDDKLTKSKPVHEKSLPPIRKQALVDIEKLKPTGLNSLNKKSPSSSSSSSASPSISTAEKAEASKAKGNEYFGKKDYKNAIESYTKAIEYNPTIPVYFVNRAMAYLKINSYLEAESDCTRGISLQPKNVKALWRRGIARRELGRISEARKDFEEALSIEPNNKSILEELNKLPKQKQQPQKQPQKQKQEEAVQKRRLPINVIDEEYPNQDLIENTSKSIKTSPPTSTKVSATSTPTSTTNAKTTQPNTSPLPSKAQAPVVETPKTQTINTKNNKTEPLPIKTEQPKTETTKIPISAKLPATFNCPRTNLEFERDWKTYKVRGDDILYQYFQCIPPSSYATLFKSSLESDQFEKIIDLLDTKYTSEQTPLVIYDVLDGLSKVRRIDMLVMFLSKSQQQALHRLFQQMKSHVENDKLTKLAKIYDIRAP